MSYFVNNISQRVYRYFWPYSRKSRWFFTCIIKVFYGQSCWRRGMILKSIGFHTKNLIEKWFRVPLNLCYLQHTSGGYQVAIWAQSSHQPWLKASSKLRINGPTYCGRPPDGHLARDGAEPISLLRQVIFSPQNVTSGSLSPHLKRHP